MTDLAELHRRRGQLLEDGKPIGEINVLIAEAQQQADALVDQESERKRRQREQDIEDRRLERERDIKMFQQAVAQMLEYTAEQEKATRTEAIENKRRIEATIKAGNLYHKITGQRHKPDYLDSSTTTRQASARRAAIINHTFRDMRNMLQEVMPQGIYHSLHSAQEIWADVERDRMNADETINALLKMPLGSEKRKNGHG